LAGKIRPNMLVIHSLTKFYSLAGLRLGGVIGSERVISKLRRAKEPWSVNCIADRVAPMLLDCTDYEEETRFMVARERERVFQRLETHEGITPFPPSANFILCQWTRTGNLDDLLCHLLNNGIYVRDCRNFPGLEQNFFRIGLRTPPENDRLVSILTSFQDNS